MEASAGSPQRLRVTYAYEYRVEGERRPEAEWVILSDAAPATERLKLLLADLAERSDLPAVIEVESVQIKEGSIMVEVAIAIYATAQALDLYGGAREGLQALIRDLERACHHFLGHFLPGPGELVAMPIWIEPLPGPIPTAAHSSSPQPSSIR